MKRLRVGQRFRGSFVRPGFRFHLIRRSLLTRQQVLRYSLDGLLI
jgi:hypothetical protein